MLSNHIYPDFFSTFFMFPFSLNLGNEFTIRDYMSALMNKGWQEKGYEIAHGIDYNEYVYFYPYIWDILFNRKGSLTDGRDVKGVTFMQYPISGQDPSFSVDVRMDDPNQEKTKVKLHLKNIFLHVFEVGVGILVFEIVHDIRYEYTKDQSFYSLEDYLRFLETGRRVFVPFVNGSTDLREKWKVKEHPLGKSNNKRLSPEGNMPAMDAIRQSIVPTHVEIKITDQKQIIHNFLDEPFLLEQEGTYKPALSKIITYFLDTDDFTYLNGSYKSIIDDRMFVHAYFSIGDSLTDAKDGHVLHPSANHYFLQSLKKAFENGIKNHHLNDAVKLWYQMIFLDWQGPSCQNTGLMKKLLEESTYVRWSGYGSFTGFSRFSSVMISNINEAGYIYNHFQSMYYQIAILLLFYRGAILNFSERSEKISNSIHALPNGKTIEKNEKKRLNGIRNETEKLNKDFLLFRNKFWFREVTAQDQGIEIFDLWSKKMRNRELMQDVQSEIKELFDFVDSTYEKDVSRYVNILTLLGAIAIPLAIVTSFFGMNLSFISDFLSKDLNLVAQTMIHKLSTSFSPENALYYSFSLIIFGMGFYLFYGATRKIYKYFSNQESFDIPTFFKMILASFGKKNKEYVFFLGGRDAEMCEIQKILLNDYYKFYDKKLVWGAKLSDYENEINELDTNFKPILIELEIDRPKPKGAKIIDHHGKKSGCHKATSIEQVAKLLGVTLNRWQQLIAVNDRAHIAGLKAFGASKDEIERIRRYDRQCQGVTEEEEQQAEKICSSFQSEGPLDILQIPFTHTSPVTDRLHGRYQNLLIITPKTINFFGNGKVVKKLGQQFNGSWYGGNLPKVGFWGMQKSDNFSPDTLITLIKSRLK